MVLETLFDPTFTLISRLALGILFVASSLLKFPDMAGFIAIFKQYRIAPSWLTIPGGYLLVIAELTIGALLLLGIVPLAAAFALTYLVVATLGVASVMLRRMRLPNCGCFGTSIRIPTGWKKIIENAFWILLSVQLLIATLPKA